MYIMITSKCNMSCKHCCNSVSKEKEGQHLEFKIIKMIFEKWGHIYKEQRRYRRNVIGGGEPTLHPDFWNIIKLAQNYGDVWITTNGKNKKDALKLAEMGKKGLITVSLSLDKFHEKIDEQVMKKFSEGLKGFFYQGNVSINWYNAKDKIDRRRIRMVLNPMNNGFAKKMEKTIERCCCEGIFFRPNGNIYACGCDDSPKIGTVKEGIVDERFKTHYLFSDCYKKTLMIFKKND
jgi:MoaA/NifB/PqqE/SkfB family radical SAM enzyme